MLAHAFPATSGPTLFAPDHDRFEPSGRGAAATASRRSARWASATWVNGPIPFSPDAEPIMGLTEDLDNLFHCCGFSAGIAAAGGAGDAMANWIIDGDPGHGPLAVRRSPVRRAAQRADGAGRAVGQGLRPLLRHRLPQPDEPAPRGQRRSAGLRPSAPSAARSSAASSARSGPTGSTPATSGPRRCRPSVAATPGSASRPSTGRPDRGRRRRSELVQQVRDQSGPGALALLQRIAGADLDSAVGKVDLHPAAQRARRHRGRRHHHPARRVTASTSSPAAVSVATTSRSCFSTRRPTAASAITDVTSALRRAQRLRTRVARSAVATEQRRLLQRGLPLHDRRRGSTLAGRRRWRCARPTSASSAGSCTCRPSTSATSTTDRRRRCAARHSGRRVPRRRESQTGEAVPGVGRRHALGHQPVRGGTRLLRQARPSPTCWPDPP